MIKLPERLKTLYTRHESVILYIFFGGLTTLVSFATHFSTRFLGGSVEVATTVSWICAVLFAFFTNRKWVFNSPTKGTAAFFRQLVSFFGARLFSFLVELAIMTVFVNFLHYNELLIKIAANVVVLILNYILSKFLVFRKKTTAAHKSAE